MATFLIGYLGLLALGFAIGLWLNSRRRRRMSRNRPLGRRERWEAHCGEHFREMLGATQITPPGLQDGAPIPRGIRPEALHRHWGAYDT